jgi:hypothetical protein
MKAGYATGERVAAPEDHLLNSADCDARGLPADAVVDGAIGVLQTVAHAQGREVAATMRAIRLPRRTTSITFPAATRSKYGAALRRSWLSAIFEFGAGGSAAPMHSTSLGGSRKGGTTSATSLPRRTISSVSPAETRSK